MMKTKLLSILLALSMVAALAGCGGASSSAPASSSASASSSTSASSQEAASSESGDAAPESSSATAIKIGFIGPLTGGAAIYGNAAKNGAQIAIDEINALDSGIQFEFNPQDDEHDAEKSVNAYNILKDWGMQILCGTVTTNPCIAVGAESYADRIFTLTPSASSTAVIEGKDNVFQMCFTDPNQGVASAQYIAEQQLGSKIAVIYNNADAYSTGIYEKFASEAANQGLEIVSTTTFTDDTATDFSVQLTDAKNAGADLLFLPIYYTPASLILTQAQSMGYSPKVFGVDGMDGILTLENFDTTLAEGVMLLTPFAADATDERTVSFVQKYTEQFNETPNQFAADAYDCIYAIYEACQKAGITPDQSAADICEKMIAAFTAEDFTFNGLTGEGMTWSTTGEVSKAPKGMVIQNGAYTGM
ncbi:MAG: amino acid ABC transporter substrate-binding protein [Oscillospiraceae bacterium]|nr:MAG: amino acid ABC transporter substrate-binding protein [Oscillospiraceae bacterium]